MIQVRKSNERGHVKHGWLDTYHTFSFAEYFDSDYMGFGALRVINDDRIVGGAGFPTHGHRDMEILTYVVEGALAHKDSMGNGTVIRPGEIQRMSAGTGVRHSEFNHLKDQTTRLLQIWVQPERTGLEPSYEQKDFTSALFTGDLVLVASRNGNKGSVSWHQDAELYAVKSSTQKSVEFVVRKGAGIWIQIVNGTLFVNDVVLRDGDSAGILQEDKLSLSWDAGTEFLLFDLH